MALMRRAMQILSGLAALQGTAWAASPEPPPFHVSQYISVPLFVSRPTAFALGALEILIIGAAIVLAVILPTPQSPQSPSRPRGSDSEATR